MDVLKIQADLKKARRQLLLFYEIGNLMRSTLQMDEIIFLILSAVTSHEALGFNRAVLFLTDDRKRELRGVFGIGPLDPKESENVWRDIDERRLHLTGFIDVYRKQKGNIDRVLNNLVNQLRIPIRRDSGVLAKVFLEARPVSVLTDEDRQEVVDPVLDQLNVDHFVAVPLKGRDQIIGTLLVDNISTKKPIAREEVRNLVMLSDHAALAIENAMVFHRVLDTSRRDSLTGLWNHAHFQELLTHSLQVARLQNQSLSLVIFDVDDFKRYNDSLGHPQGDLALRTIARIARSALRRNDYIARYGGEEFALIFPGSDKRQAQELAEKLRNAVEEETSGIFQSETLRQITISGGIATFPEDADDREKLIFCADAALYEAKKRGKNRIFPYRKV